ncbi:phosphopantetheine-binding protein [Alistipes onderdonkii]|uniref:Phosphopantetheine-binding protein n=1 Tax=Alistipes onderdonkii TaxID=328813 RepID=A0AAJ1CCL8_9BACT|nr:phosphopantetheine-binding protein [Alistipes onderdonkii]MCQ5082015.1 phosphopantetheine-binding protein [Alistipes onderdonkii]
MGSEITVWWGPDDMVSALGFGTEENMTAVRAMKSSLASWHDATPVCLIDRKRLGALAAEQGLAGYTPLERLVLATLGGVVARSGVTPADKRTLIVLATTKGEIGSLGSAPERCDLNRTAEVVGRHFGAAHRPLLVSNACISGVSAIVIAARLIRSGRYDHVFVAGFDLLCDFIVSGFNAFKSVSPTLCRPYDASRDGLTLGEACGAVLLTRDQRLSGTGVSVVGGGISNDANHISAPSRTGDGLWYAIRAALAEAGTGAGEVGLVNTHGTATVYNDEMESKALHLAGLCGVPCNSLKPYFGHTLGASGVIESIVTVRELCEGTCFGVKGYAECGVPYPPDVSAAHREIRTDTALKTASGFGGCNAAVVFRRAAGPNAAPGNETAEGQGCGPNTGVQGGNDCLEAACTRSGTAMSANDRGHGKNAVGHGNPDTGEKAGGHAETGTGRHGSGIRCHDTAHVVIAQHPSLPFDAFIRERYRALADPNMKFSKMDDLCKLAYVASCELLSGHRPDCPAERIGVVMANRSASLDSDRRHQAIIDAGDGCGASPAVFVYTLPNIMLGQVAIKHGLKGESTFFAFPDKSSNFIREYTASLIAEGRMDAVLWGWCEFDGGSYDCELTLTEKTGQDTMEDLELQLKQQIIEALNLEEITADEIATDAPLFGDGLGLDSIDALEITLLLEKHYGIRLANPAQAKPIFYSVATLADFIRKNRPQ